MQLQWLASFKSNNKEKINIDKPLLEVNICKSVHVQFMFKLGQFIHRLQRCHQLHCQIAFPNNSQHESP